LLANSLKLRKYLFKGTQSGHRVCRLVHLQLLSYFIATPIGLLFEIPLSALAPLRLAAMKHPG